MNLTRASRMVCGCPQIQSVSFLLVYSQLYDLRCAYISVRVQCVHMCVFQDLHISLFSSFKCNKSCRRLFLYWLQVNNLKYSEVLCMQSRSPGVRGR